MTQPIAVAQTTEPYEKLAGREGASRLSSDYVLGEEQLVFVEAESHRPYVYWTNVRRRLHAVFCSEHEETATLAFDPTAGRAAEFLVESLDNLMELGTRNMAEHGILHLFTSLRRMNLPGEVVSETMPIEQFPLWERSTDEADISECLHTYVASQHKQLTATLPLEVATHRLERGRHAIVDTLSGILGLNRLRVPVRVDERVLPLLDPPTVEAGRVVVGILADRISEGVPVNSVAIEPLTDVDAAQWAEVVFTLDVNLDTEQANHEWDEVLAMVSLVEESSTTMHIAESLRDRIAIHFAWTDDTDVQS